MTADDRFEPGPAIRFRAAEAQMALERQLDAAPPATPRLLVAAQLLLGAMAIGLFSAGLAILGVLVVLNLVFHYSPN
jgi:hypothetical protein